MALKLVIFDFDGTLVDSEPGILEAICHTVAALNLPEEAIESWRQMIGIPLEKQLAALLPEGAQNRIPEGVEIYRRFYDAIRSLHSQPFPGILELLADLAERIPLAIASSKRRESILPVLDQWGYGDLFEPIISPAEVTYPKPHPDSVERILAHHDLASDQAVLIGDTEYDIEMARRAGVGAWGVGWGIHPLERLYQAGADRGFRDVQALHQALAELWV
ncbi:HAD family hydrolase [Synechococcus sp. Nb3U1]|uniref:HAD family hydrolase n=1 Tax=Synechococcus sp. Nb3U1 TaxID=1914529 RepID=UPI001F1A3369|nr:HAD family hydrolase [Synechococcus sp. Nb3U1]MCF2972694.1 HAD family hydrolase [Synechococcus sp. Nb3U1]